MFCKLFFLFGCHAVVANCAFARYCQKFVAFITSARYCVGILRFSQCIFVVLQHNKSDFRYLLVSSTFQRQKIAFVVFFAFEITCALQKRFAYCLVLGRICRQAKAVSAMCCNIWNTTYKENLTSPQFIDNFTQDIQGIKKTALSRFFVL